MSARNRKLNYLTYAQRKEIIKKLDQNVSQRKLAVEYGVSPSTINAINKPESRVEILQAIQKSSDANNQRKRPPTKNAGLNEMVLKFVEDCRAKNVRISGPLLKETAKKYAEKLNLQGFGASNGWLNVFCTKYKISFRKPDGLTEAKEETGELKSDEDRNLLSNTEDVILEEHLHLDDDVEADSDYAEPVIAVKAEMANLEASLRSRKRLRLDNPISKTVPPMLNRFPSSAPTVLHSNGMIYVTLANGTSVEIDNETINIRTTSNELVTVSKDSTSVLSGTSQLSVKDGVIHLKPTETKKL